MTDQADVMALTVRMPREVYGILRDYAQVSDMTMNDVMVMSLRRLFTEDATDKALDTLFKTRRAGLRRAVGRLRQEDAER